MLLIGLGYKARQGKSTAALAMLEACPLGDARLVAFADALRAEVAKATRQMDGVPNLIESFKLAGIMPDWVHAEEYPQKQRTLLQWWGTEYRRSKDPDYWVKRLFESLDKLKPDTAIITDVRFPNEVEAIHAAGGYAVKVVRLGEPDVKVPAHASESVLDGYDGWDYTLEAATLSELKRKTNQLYEKIVGRHALSRP
jgi:hypothetical protein